ncbi:MAG: SDR family oxidoreductase [Cyanobacteria bacterium J06643_13]
MSLKKRLQAAFCAFKHPELLNTQIRLPRTICSPKLNNYDQLLVGKNVLITGAGRNIGRAIAESLAEQGANIYFTDIDANLIAELEQKLRSLGVVAHGWRANINDTNKTDKLCSYLAKNKLSIDILVNNVGRQFDHVGLGEITHAQRVETFTTNVLSPMYLTQKIVAQMIKNRVQGSILFISSIHQDVPFRNPSYSGSKAALGAIIKELAIDLAGYKIRVNGIAPGWIAQDKHGNTLHHSYTALHQSSIKPSYIGRAAVYLTADYFSYYTTGTILKIDAGLSLHNYRLEQHPPLAHPSE